MTPTITCPHCQREHAVYWKRSSAKHRSLMYFCDHVQKRKIPKGMSQYVYFRGSNECAVNWIDLEQLENNPNIPEKWSKKMSKSKQEEIQCKLPLMLNVP